MADITNIHSTPLTVQKHWRGGEWRYLDLSGERLGARIEVLEPGESSSVHHYHTLEEEHVLLLEGSATLHLGDEEVPMQSGDHIAFRAGSEVAHHLENRGDAPCRLLVFGERLPGDVVFYPETQHVLVKTPQRQLYSYRERALPKAD